MPITRFQFHLGKINTVAWNHTNKIIASAGEDCKIVFTPPDTVKKLDVFEDIEEPSPIQSLSFTSKSDLLAAGCQNGSVKIWDLRKRELTARFRSHSEQINSITWSPIDSHIASASNTGDIILHSMVTGSPVANFKQPQSRAIKCIKYSPFKKQLIAAGGERGSIYIWDTNSRGLYTTFNNVHNSAVTALAFSSANPLLFCSGGLDQRVQFFDINEKRQVNTLDVDSPVTSMSFKGDGHTIALGTMYGNILIYDLRVAQSTIQILSGHSGASVNAVDFAHIRGRNENAPTSSAQVSNLRNQNENQSNRFRTIEEIRQEARNKVEQKRRNEKSESKAEKAKAKPPDPPQENVEKVEPPPKQPPPLKQPPAETPPLRVNINRAPSPILTPAAVTPSPNKPPEPRSPESQVPPPTVIPPELTNPENRTFLDAVKSRLEGMSSNLGNDLSNIHIELIRQFTIQMNELTTLLNNVSVENSELLNRYKDLSEENERLKKTSF